MGDRVTRPAAGLETESLGTRVPPEKAEGIIETRGHLEAFGFYSGLRFRRVLSFDPQPVFFFVPVLDRQLRDNRPKQSSLGADLRFDPARFYSRSSRMLRSKAPGQLRIDRRSKRVHQFRPLLHPLTQSGVPQRLQ